MPTQISLEQIEQAELIQAVDDARAATGPFPTEFDMPVPNDPFRLPAELRTLLNSRLADLKTKDAATLVSGARRATASAKAREALDQLRTLLRDGFNYIQGLGSFAISDADRLGVFTSYGWQGGRVGELSDARIESLANQAITATPTIFNAAHRYPDALLALITTQLDILNANQPLATGGSAQSATDARDAALALLQLVNARIRFFYCSASDDTDQTSELAKIGRQPRRESGTATAQPSPAEPGPVTFDAETLTLTADTLPAHATTLRAYRQPAGGDAELAGTSTTTTVSVVELGPLAPGVTYEFWLVGHNSQGEGPASERITFVAV